MGDFVLSEDATTGEMAFKPVENVIPAHDRNIFELVVEGILPDGTTRLRKFETTDDHPWMLESGQWASTSSLEIGTFIQVAYGKNVKVISVIDTHQYKLTFNLEIADFHTYFVGQDRVLVHNQCDNKEQRDKARCIAGCGVFVGTTGKSDRGQNNFFKCVNSCMNFLGYAGY